jgi:hypothetical protein
VKATENLKSDYAKTKAGDFERTQEAVTWLRVEMLK